MSFFKLFDRFLDSVNHGEKVPLGFVDWHSHILPGVDDGVKTINESMEILRQYESLGIREVWFTPHIMEDCPNTTESLKRCFDDFKDAYNGTIKLGLASENMIDGLFMERLDADDLLSFPDGTLLVETSYFNPPMGLYEILERIIEKGYKPLLAHPERYNYMDMDGYNKIRSMGIGMQLNLMSCTGMYGKPVMRKAFMLADINAYSHYGSDLHSIKQLGYLRESLSLRQVAGKIEGIINARHSM